MDYSTETIYRVLDLDRKAVLQNLLYLQETCCAGCERFKVDYQFMLRDKERGASHIAQRGADQLIERIAKVSVPEKPMLGKEQTLIGAVNCFHAARHFIVNHAKVKWARKPITTLSYDDLLVMRESEKKPGSKNGLRVGWWALEEVLVFVAAHRTLHPQPDLMAEIALRAPNVAVPAEPITAPEAGAIQKPGAAQGRDIEQGFKGARGPFANNKHLNEKLAHFASRPDFEAEIANLVRRFERR